MNTTEKRGNKTCDCPSKVSRRAKKFSMFLIPKVNQNWLLYK